MKKKDILSLLEYKKHSYNSLYGKAKDHDKIVDELENPFKYIMYIKEIKNEINILEIGFNKLKNKRTLSEKYVKNHEEEVNHINCTHPIIHGEIRRWGVSYRCALCDKQVHDEKNRVRLMREDYNVDRDDYEYPPILSGYKEFKHEFDLLCTLINLLLKDYSDEEEIDFNSLFNRSYDSYDIGIVEVDGHEEIKNKVLLISGSNTIKLDNNIFIKREEKYDNRLLKTLLDINCFDIYNVTSFKENYYEQHTFYYETISELKKVLSDLSDNEFNIIIDISNLFDYKVCNGIITTFETQDILSPLKNIFPESNIYHIKSTQDEINLFEDLKNMFLKNKTKRKSINNIL